MFKRSGRSDGNIATIGTIKIELSSVNEIIDGIVLPFVNGRYRPNVLGSPRVLGGYPEDPN